MASILVVDDDEMVRLTLRHMLERGGHQVTLAANGVDALAALGASRFDLIVTDMIMPEKDGIETIIEVRRRLPHLRILAISGGGRTRNLDFLKYARSVGANAILAKPFNNEELTTAVAEALH